MRKVYFLLMLAILAIASTSCTDDDDWGAPLVGSWESIYTVDNDNTYPVSGYDVERFDFYEDGEGTYFYYAKGVPMSVDFVWDASSDGRIAIRYSDGVDEYSYFDFENGCLCISRDASFYQYTVFRLR